MERDFLEAFKWIRLAAEQGHATAQMNLGVFYQNGWGVQQDEAEAERWFRLSAEQGFEPAMKRLETLKK